MAHLDERYLVAKRDGSEIDPEAQYFVLRLDGPGHDAERVALRCYALCTPDRELARDIVNLIDGIEDRLPPDGYERGFRRVGENEWERRRRRGA